MPIPDTQTIWHLPYQRNPFFTGREDVLTQLHRALEVDATVALSHPQGISGLGGIGKTQTALEYAYRYRNDYTAVLWIRADSITALTSSMIELAHVLELPERHEQDQEIIIEAALRWLRLHPGWLLIYDNIDDFSIAEPFLPKAGAGHLLFTTRAYALGGLAQRLDIQKMEPEIGALLLLRRADLLTLQATLNRAKPNDRSMAQAISLALDGLPLALDQAGAYIKEAPCPLPEYLTRYQTRQNDLLRERGSFDQDYPASVATTWSLSFENVRHVNPASADLLNFCAFLAPDAIPETMITKGASHLPPFLQEAIADTIAFDQTVATLLAYSLLHRNLDETLDIHRLVQTVLRDDMPTENQLQWKRQTILAIDTASPDVGDVTQWDMCEQWVNHALICAHWIEEDDMQIPEAARLLNQAGYYLDDRARSTEAEPLLVQTLRIKEQQLGTEHISTAISCNNLASLYQIQGKFEKAEPLYIQALAIYEQQSGPNHPDTATSINNLAGLYYNQGKYTEALPLYERALSIRKLQLGSEHLDTAISLNSLGLFYHYQGRYKEALPFYQQTLKIREQQLGSEHPLTATSLNNLGGLYSNQGMYTEALPLYTRALAIDEKVYGANHPTIATDLNNLASLYQSQEKYTEALPLYERALQICEQILGPNHYQTAMSLNNLAGLYHSQGMYTEALPLYERALAIDKEVYGTSHLEVAIDLNNLASLYQNQERYREALLLYKEALQICEQQLDPAHLQTMKSLNNLAGLYKRQGKHSEAELLYRRALVICEQQLGAEHPYTQIVRENYEELHRE